MWKEAIVVIFILMNKRFCCIVIGAKFHVSFATIINRKTGSVEFSFSFQLVDISDGFLSLMDDSGEVRDDVRCPDNDLGKDISARFEKDEQLLVSSFRDRSV